MSQTPPKKRLDEILISEGLISEEQIKEALMRQKAHGGKFGSQLLYHRYIDEATLVKALSIQLNSEGVILSKLDIHEMVLKMIPEKVAIARNVIPFDYDPANNLLKIACNNPCDNDLYDELKFVARGKEIKLYIAAEVSINTAINKFYLGKNINLESSLQLDIPNITTDTGKIPTKEITKTDDAPRDTRPAILVVTDEQYAVPLIISLLERDNYVVTVTDSADDAIRLLGEDNYHSVLIKDTVPGDYIDLIDRVRKLSPSTSVRYYESASDLLLNTGEASRDADLTKSNLDIFTSLIASKENRPVNHSGRVGQYSDRLCKRLELPSKDRMLISTAAYIHDIAGYYYDSEESTDNRKVISLTIKLLSSLGYSPIIIEMLRSMYINLGGKYTRRLPIEVLGGNILTITDLFAESIPHNERLSLDKFDTIKKKIRDMTGKLFLVEVVEAFIDMIQEEILNLTSSGNAGQVMILSNENTSAVPIEMRLNTEGYRTLTVNSIESFNELYHRSEPDLIIVISLKKPDEIIHEIDRLTQCGVGLEQTPTYLITEHDSIAHLTNLLDKGIEDIISLDDNLDLLANKIRKLQVRIDTRAEKAGGAAGAHGRLSDMNLIDLLQALGPGRKTVKITISKKGTDKTSLAIFLDNGHITHAKLNSLTGPEAIYEGLTWADGTWAVSPITVADIPEPNNQASNESILMEGCRLMDERMQSGQLL
ncbi:MAG: DUF4388 domain-containing protein [candidate division Zixibacteria bacterium]|nr:DUF4388 domain-containing protein [candidate division Zixibacteria bacterium]